MVKIVIIFAARFYIEVANNSRACGIILTLADDTVGTVPRLQLLTGNDKTNRIVKQISRWTSAVAGTSSSGTMATARGTLARAVPRQYKWNNQSGRLLNRHDSRCSQVSIIPAVCSGEAPAIHRPVRTSATVQEWADG